MDLFDLMSQGREDKALDRLEGILALYQSASEEDQDQALERARAFCDLEWGSYPEGLSRLAARWARKPGMAARADSLAEEGERPGTIIRALRHQRQAAGTREGERLALIARHGSPEAALRPTPFELEFIEAAQDAPDLEAAVAAAHPLPATIEAARAESLRWRERLHHFDLLSPEDGPAHVLAAPCARRHALVEAMWRQTLPADSVSAFAARLEYWAGAEGTDPSGYGVLAADFAALAPRLGRAGGGVSTKDRARALRQANPDWSLARIGKELGISRQAVHKHLREGGAK